MTFNIGDKVKAKPDYSHHYSFGNRVVTVTRSVEDGNTFTTDDSPHRSFHYLSCRFELVQAAPDPVAEAKLLLEKNGFTVTDPPKPRTRDVVAYYFYGHPETIHFAELNYFVNKRDWASPPIRIGGIFQWTEELKL